MTTPPPAYYAAPPPAPNPTWTPPAPPRTAVLPWLGFGSAALALLLAVIPFSAGIAWLPALAAIVLGIISLVRKSRPTWPSIVAVTLGPIAWVLAIIVTVVVWAIASADQMGPAAAPQQPVVVATGEPIEAEEPVAAPSSEPVESETETPVESPVPVAEPPALPGIGETVMVDDWAFTVISVGARAATAGESRWSDGAQAQGEFVPIIVRVENHGAAAESFTPNDVVAIDPEGRQFSYSSDASIYADDSLDWYDEINPGNAVEGAIYFDVPPGTPLDRVLLDGGWFDDPAEIALQ
ncbi:DUF4352 domain-containing protein [Agrococcus sp. DT81.2]|uniref:DUF4352 domain-containing protein n=1 Tax=Agrococcus sp. DT81.2 TaxID=3393414 RepID=UPI003CE4B645